MKKSRVEGEDPQPEIWEQIAAAAVRPDVEGIGILSSAFHCYLKFAQGERVSGWDRTVTPDGANISTSGVGAATVVRTGAAREQCGQKGKQEQERH